MKQKGNTLVVLIFIVLLVAGMLYFKSKQANIPAQQSKQSNTERSKTFHSDIMKFSITVPSKFQSEEKLGSTTILSSKGAIFIDRNGTNFDKVENYVKDLGEKNRFVLTDQSKIQINNLNAIVGKLRGEKIYFVYIDNAVYTLSTKDQILFEDLDKIARSFRYTP